MNKESKEIAIEAAIKILRANGSKVSTHAELARTIQTALKQERVDKHMSVSDYRRVMADARVIFEVDYKKTLWTWTAVGYSIANPTQTALISARTLKKCVTAAYHFKRRYKITDKTLIPDAIKVTFKAAERKALELSDLDAKLLTYKVEKK